MQQPGVISTVKKGACHCVAAAPDIPDHLLVRDLLFVSLHTLWDCVCLTLIIQPSDRLTRWFSDICRVTRFFSDIGAHLDIFQNSSTFTNKIFWTNQSLYRVTRQFWKIHLTLLLKWNNRGMIYTQAATHMCAGCHNIGASAGGLPRKLTNEQQS